MLDKLGILILAMAFRAVWRIADAVRSVRATFDEVYYWVTGRWM